MTKEIRPHVAGSSGAVDAPPQDLTVDRRWFLSRMAGVWAAAGAGTTALAGLPAPAAAAPAVHPGVWHTAYARTIRPEALADYTELTISEAAAALRRGLLTPVDLMAAYLDRVARFEAVYQAFLWRQEDKVLLAAAARVRVTPSSTPLAGIVTAEKDNFYTAGIPTTAMSPVLADFVPAFDSTVHARLKAAGAIMLGKAAMGPLASGPPRLPDGTATTRNAWIPDDPRYSPGGSSGGTATAVAGRLATAGTGTQTGGSITNPAIRQNLTGLKPTFGRASLYGTVPLAFTRDHPGPMARDAMDAAIMLQSFAGPDRNDVRTRGMPPVPNLVRAATVHTHRGRPSVRWRTTVGYPSDYLTGASYLKVQQARHRFLHLILSQVFDRCDVVLVGPVIGLPLISFPYGMGTDEATGLTVPRGAILGGPPFGEQRLLAVVAAYQAVTDHHLKRPPDPTTTRLNAAKPYRVPADHDATWES